MLCWFTVCNGSVVLEERHNTCGEFWVVTGLHVSIVSAYDTFMSFSIMRIARGITSPVLRSYWWLQCRLRRKHMNTHTLRVQCIIFFISSHGRHVWYRFQQLHVWGDAISCENWRANQPWRHYTVTDVLILVSRSLTETGTDLLASTKHRRSRKPTDVVLLLNSSVICKMITIVLGERLTLVTWACQWYDRCVNVVCVL